VPVGGKVTLEGNLSIPKNASWTKVEVLIAYSQTKKIIGDILNVISTHSASDGKIFVYNVEEAYDIGTKKAGHISL
jgi:nitrogen regulatory protein PII